jgi:hypothetical protein
VKKSLLILAILLYNSVDLPLGARRTKKKEKRKEIHSGILFLGLGFQEFWLSSSVCLFLHQVVFCESYLQFFLCIKKRKKENPTSKETELRRRRRRRSSCCCV